MPKVIFESFELIKKNWKSNQLKLSNKVSLSY